MQCGAMLCDAVRRGVRALAYLVYVVVWCRYFPIAPMIRGGWAVSERAALDLRSVLFGAPEVPPAGLAVRACVRARTCIACDAALHSTQRIRPNAVNTAVCADPQ